MTGRDEIRTLYRTMVTLGAAAVVILIAGLGEFVFFEPFYERSGATATVTGVYAYNLETGQTGDADRTHFARDEAFAAVVDWSSVNPDLVVAAHWFNTFGEVVGGVGPGRAGTLADRPLVPVRLPRGLKRNLPGQYLFVVERYSGGRAVEVLARRLVLVERRP